MPMKAFPSRRQEKGTEDEERIFADTRMVRMRKELSEKDALIAKLQNISVANYCETHHISRLVTLFLILISQLRFNATGNILRLFPVGETRTVASEETDPFPESGNAMRGRKLSAERIPAKRRRVRKRLQKSRTCCIRQIISQSSGPLLAPIKSP